MYKISIIITTFNNEMYIIDSINSLLNQSYKNIEIIIIDDISTDNTVELVNNYIQENYLRIVLIYIYNKRDKC